MLFIKVFGKNADNYIASNIVKGYRTVASLSVSLSNLLKNLNYQYAMASQQNASNVAESASKNTASSSSATNAKTAGTQTSVSALTKLLGTISKKTSVLDNTSVITSDMVTEFFKSYKNSAMTSIYNKLQAGSSMTEDDLKSFNSQISKLSASEQKLWKSEISKIQAQISSKIQASTNPNTSTVNNTSTNKKSGVTIVTSKVAVNNNVVTTKTNTSATGSTAKTTTVNNGFVSGVLYVNGTKYTGSYTDGKYYQNGSLANGVINGKYYQNGVLANGTVDGVNYVNGVAQTSTTPANTNTNNSNSNTAGAVASTVVSKKTDSNGNTLGYDSKGNLVYLEKTVNGKKVVYTDELKYLNSKTLKYLTSVGDAVLTDRMMDDIKIVKNAEKSALNAGEKGSTAYKNAYNESIKSQMIKTTSTMKGEAGEVVESNGSLYVNDGSKLVKLNISAKTYLELFPPVDRYDVNQNSIGDCYFVSGCLTDMMKNGETYAQLLQMFSENSNGDITVKFAGSLSSKSVTFENGELKKLDGKVDGKTVTRYTLSSGSKGTQMLEEAYAIATFSKESGKNVNSIDIDETISSIKGGWQYNVYNEVLGMKSERQAVSAKSVASYLNSIANSVNNGDTLLSFASYYANSAYGLSSKHAYSIESIDSKNQVVYIANPWYSGSSIAVPYSEFAKVAYSANDMVYFSLGYVNA